jgi:hypothetical protein
MSDKGVIPINIEVESNGRKLNYTFHKENVNYYRDYFVPDSAMQTIIYMKASDKGIVINKPLEEVRQIFQEHSVIYDMLYSLSEEKLALVKQFISEMR